MNRRILTKLPQAFATCARLPGRETNLARREMKNTSGGLVPPGPYLMPGWIGRIVAEAIANYFDD